MKKLDQLRRSEYTISMKILDLEGRQLKPGFSKKEEAELEILLKKKEKLAEQIAKLKR